MLGRILPPFSDQESHVMNLVFITSWLPRSSKTNAVPHESKEISQLSLFGALIFYLCSLTFLCMALPSLIDKGRLRIK